jgi:hypothetical protein
MKLSKIFRFRRTIFIQNIVVVTGFLCIAINFSTVSAAPAEVQEQLSQEAEKEADLDTITQKIKKLKEQNTAVFGKLEREWDKLAKLRKELLSETSTGCWANEPIKKFEVYVNGAHLERSRIGLKKEETKDTKERAKQMSYLFGEGLSYVNADEFQQGTLVPNGHFILADLERKKISDFDHIIVQKGGVGYHISRECHSGFLGIGGGCKDRYYEDSMYRIDSLLIKMNDQVAYRKDNIDFVFRDGELSWIEKNISNNPEYLSLMARTDCPRHE